MNRKTWTLLCGGLLALPAVAQSNVTLSGVVAVSYNNHKVTDTVRPAATENRLDDNSSRFILKGTEDLGGGLSAYFQIENRFSVDTRPNSTFGSAQGLADGESFVGLASKSLGQIGFGKFQLHYQESNTVSEVYRAQQTQILAAQNILSQVDTLKVAGGTRLQNTLRYDTPNWSGFTGRIGYSFSPLGNEGTLSNTGASGGCTVQYTNSTSACGPTAATDNRYNKGYAWSATGRYNAGPINALLSYFDLKPENGTRSTGHNSWRAHVDYRFPFGLKLGVGYDKTKVLGATSSADSSRSAWLIPVTYTTGAHAFYATYAKANSRSGVADSGARQYTLAYDYGLSKRTFVGVSYVNLANDRNARYRLWNSGYNTQGGSEIAANGENSRVFSLNLTHLF